MRLCKITRPFLFAAWLLSCFLVSVTAHAQDPDFSSIDDPLNGSYKLFRVDDLMIDQPVVLGDYTILAYSILKTDNNVISSEK